MGWDGRKEIHLPHKFLEELKKKNQKHTILLISLDHFDCFIFKRETNPNSFFISVLHI